MEHRIFLVEDDRSLADAICAQMKLWALDCVCAADFRAVMAEFARVQPHLVLMDVSLPYMSGYHWCAEIRRVSSVPVIFISSASDNMNIIMAMNMGGDDFVAKPFDTNVLIAKVQALLRRTYEFGAAAPLLEHAGAILNTGDNTPAVIYSELVPGDRVEITVAPKGFGSENMSQIRMLRPSDGLEGVKEFVLKVVQDAGPNPCPPVVVGVGIGGTFDKAAYLAKKALLRPVDEPNADPFYAALERELLEKINTLGIGPQGLGGATTALAVNVEWFPTHIAGLPVAVNINCHVTRHRTEVL